MIFAPSQHSSDRRVLLSAFVRNNPSHQFGLKASQSWRRAFSPRRVAYRRIYGRLTKGCVTTLFCGFFTPVVLLVLAPLRR